VSRAKPIAEREALDFYATPQPLADAICRHLAAQNATWRCVVEPSAGHGPFVRAARTCWPGAEIVAVDVDVEKLLHLSRTEADTIFTDDWCSFVRVPREPPFARTLIVGNPPYREAEEHIRAALGWMRDGDALAFLLRLNLLGSRSRVALWNETPLAEVVPVVPRPSFTGGSTDATEYAVFVWRKGYEGPARLSRPLSWSKGTGT
jgi:hypothetical protein